MNKHRKQNIDHYEWYLGNGRYLYGRDVCKYLMPRYRKARSLYLSLLSQLNRFYPTGDLVNDYLDLMELLSQIQIQTELLEDDIK